MTNEDPKDCRRCGLPHARCKGHNRAGGPCGKGPLPGQLVCGNHGGKSPQALEAADRRLAERAAQSSLESFGLPIAVDPHAALLQELHRTAGAVEWLGAIVADLERDDISWGRIREKTGGEDHGTTYEAGKNVWVGLWQGERKHLMDVASACAKAGIEERRVQLAEDQGRMLAGVITRILAGMFDALVAGLGDFEQARVLLEQMWGQLVGQIVPAELRAIATAEVVA